MGAGKSGATNRIQVTGNGMTRHFNALIIFRLNEKFLSPCGSLLWDEIDASDAITLIHR